MTVEDLQSFVRCSSPFPMRKTGRGILKFPFFGLALRTDTLLGGIQMLNVVIALLVCNISSRFQAIFLFVPFA